MKFDTIIISSYAKVRENENVEPLAEVHVILPEPEKATIIFKIPIKHLYNFYRLLKEEVKEIKIFKHR